MSKLTTLIVAASLSGAVATTTYVALNQTSTTPGTTSTTAPQTTYLAPATTPAIADVAALREQNTVVPFVTPKGTYSGGNSSGAQAGRATLSVPQVSSSLPTAHSAAAPARSAATASKTGIAGNVITTNSTQTFVPTQSNGTALLAMSVASSRMASSSSGGSASGSTAGFVAISRDNSSHQQGLFAAAGETTTAPPPPGGSLGGGEGSPLGKDRLPLTGEIYALLLFALAYTLTYTLTLSQATHHLFRRDRQ